MTGVPAGQVRRAPLHVLVAGAGIGGLTLACALRHAGLRVTVFERARELRPAGAGITVQANAMAALQQVGLAEAVAAVGHTLHFGNIVDASGRPIIRVPAAAVQRLVEEAGAPTVALSRTRLQGVLLAAAGEERLRLGVGVTGFHEEAGGVEAALSDGSSVRGDVLVGADGLHSAVRRQLHGEEPLRYAGYTSWRGLAPATALPADLAPSEAWGRGARFGIVPLGAEAVYWFATLNARAGERDVPGQTRARLLAHFGDWHAPIRTVLEATPEERVLRTDIQDRPPLAQWGRGRVTLLGDAAHPMTPNLGQGGGMAIEDAVVLAACLAREADVPRALATYEQRRRPRANGMVERSLRMGRLAQLDSAAACRLRDALFRLMPASLTVRPLREAMVYRV